MLSVGMFILQVLSLIMQCHNYAVNACTKTIYSFLYIVAFFLNFILLIKIINRLQNQKSTINYLLSYC